MWRRSERGAPAAMLVRAPAAAAAPEQMTVRRLRTGRCCNHDKLKTGAVSFRVDVRTRLQRSNTTVFEMTEEWDTDGFDGWGL
ncbi:hypothetical protein INR49_032845 [Caranx melampygus]|nr:hypothetical protein INR49_032845 [Caranx melampygus]